MEQDTRRAGVPSASIGVGSLAGTGFWKSANDGSAYHTEVVIIHTIRVSTHSRNTAYIWNATRGNMPILSLANIPSSPDDGGHSQTCASSFIRFSEDDELGHHLFVDERTSRTMALHFKRGKRGGGGSRGVGEGYCTGVMQTRRVSKCTGFRLPNTRGYFSTTTRLGWQV